MLRNRVLSYGSSLAVVATLVGACATQEVRDTFTDKPAAAADSGAQGAQTTGDGGGSSGSVITGTTGGKKIDLTGTTFAPNGKLPLAGVLVYWSVAAPDPIPEGVYCDTCVQLPTGTSTLSAPDGTFTLNVPTAQDVYIVSQKGQFRRVRKVSFKESDTTIDKDISTLPGKSKAAEGDTIPKIALLDEPTGDSLDPIQIALQGLGIEEWDNFESDHSKIKNELSNYNIAMFPCGADDFSPPDAEDVDAIRAFVASGGKIYASDWDHEYADKSFPEFFTAPLEHEGESNPDGTIVDQDMSTWLTKIGDDAENVQFKGVWTKFNGIQSAEVPTPANDGTTAVLEPKVWTHVTSDDESKYGSGEASISFPYGCGRGMLSIFHVHGDDSSNLLEQEKALLYMLLEVSACVKPGGDVH